MKNVLAIGAHPDDIEFGCYGTLHRHINDGDNVTLLVMSYSDVRDAYTDNITRNSQISKQEALSASNVLGVDVILGPFQDTQIQFNSETIKFIESIVKLIGCSKHKSQIDKFTEHGFDIIDNVTTLAKYRGTQCSVKYAEAFNVLKMCI